MIPSLNADRAAARVWLGVALAAGVGLASLGLLLAGCGTPGAPQPPSLKLPEPVADLTAVRAGDRVALHWTMPRRTTDRLPLSAEIRGPIPARVCVRESPTAECETVGEFAFSPGVEADAQTAMPPRLAAGAPRPVLYCVELRNKAGRSAGLSNPAEVAAGAAPPAVAGLTAEVRADGVALRWSGAGDGAAIRLHRKLLTPVAPSKPSGPIQPSPEPVERDLLVDPPDIRNGALDATTRFGEAYAYTAQRVASVQAGGRQMELAGAVSPPVTVHVVDIFPPAIPRGLAAVFVAQDKTVDLSWEPDTDADLAGYFVYRTEAGAGSADWRRISGPDPLTGPAYRDGAIEAGHAYRYAVTAIDLTGHESQRSAEAEQAIPVPAPNS